MQRTRPLAPALLDSAARLLADAFFTNPPHVYVCPDPRRRRAQLEWLLGGNLKLQPSLDASFCLVEEEAVVAMGFWTHSHAPRIATARMLRAGLLQAPRRLGLGGVRRMFEVAGAIDRHLARALGDAPYWYLNNVAVREDLRGAGVGTRLLREQLERIGTRAPGEAIALSTQRTENVTFYGRLGFRPVVEETIGRGERAFRSWILRYAPAA